MIGDAELLELRQTYYSLFVKLLWVEPEAKLVSSLTHDLEERAAGASELHPQMGEGWRMIGKALETIGPEQVVDEFTRLFLGPHRPVISPYESFYLTGTLYNEPLIEVRGFMDEVGLERIEKKYAEPEDMLAFELEIMNWLIAKQKKAAKPQTEEKWLKRQADFLTKHLLVWAPTCAADMANLESAPFYVGVGKVLQGFLAFEREIFDGMGLGEIKPLEEARRRYTKGGFSGPVYDPLEDPRVKEGDTPDS